MPKSTQFLHSAYVVQTREIIYFNSFVHLLRRAALLKPQLAKL